VHRLLHLTSLMGWDYRVVLIPLAGVVIVLLWFCSRGTPGPNSSGADPLGTDMRENFG
jgi:uncharacterized membrane protein YhaH (DUF805 family)